MSKQKAPSKWGVIIFRGPTRGQMEPHKVIADNISKEMAKAYIGGFITALEIAFGDVSIFRNTDAYRVIINDIAYRISPMPSEHIARLRKEGRL